MKARRGAWNGILMVGAVVKRILPDEVDHEVSKSQLDLATLAFKQA